MAVARAQPKKRLTEEEFMRLPDDGRKYELVDGEVKEVPTGGLHEDVGMLLALVLGPHALKVGRIYGSSLGCRMQSGNIRAPDVSVMLASRLPDGKSPSAFLEGAPDLCVEVISPSEERREMFRKVGEYFDSGAQQVWHIFPETRRVVVYSLTDDIRVLQGEDELTAGDLIPGFSCRVSDIFPAE